MKQVKCAIWPDTVHDLDGEVTIGDTRVITGKDGRAETIRREHTVKYSEYELRCSCLRNKDNNPTDESSGFSLDREPFVG